MSLCTPSDFLQGSFKISQNCFSEKDIQEAIDRYESLYLCQLLGDELKALFLADFLGGVPQTQRFIDIWDAFCNTDDCGGQIHISESMKLMLKGVIYFHYNTEEIYKATPVGTISQDQQNASTAMANQSFRNAEIRYNDAVRTYKAIQWFILDNSAIYPEFEGVEVEFSFNGYF